MEDRLRHDRVLDLDQIGIHGGGHDGQHGKAARDAAAPQQGVQQHDERQADHVLSDDQRAGVPGVQERGDEERIAAHADRGQRARRCGPDEAVAVREPDPRVDRDQGEDPQRQPRREQ